MLHLLLLGMMLLIQAFEPVTCDPQPRCEEAQCPHSIYLWAESETDVYAVDAEQTYLVSWPHDAREAQTMIALPPDLQDERLLLQMSYAEASETIYLMAGSPFELYRIQPEVESFQLVDFDDAIEGGITLCNDLYDRAYLSSKNDMFFCTSERSGEGSRRFMRLYRFDGTDVELLYEDDGYGWRAVVMGLDGSLVIQEMDYPHTLVQLDADTSNPAQVIELETSRLTHDLGRLVGVDQDGNFTFMTTDRPANADTTVIARFTAQAEFVWEVETMWRGLVIEWLGDDQFLARLRSEGAENPLFETAVCTINP